ncbi:hypothetical protein B7463_g2137, partial [Scytalidium lignicola]
MGDSNSTAGYGTGQYITAPPATGSARCRVQPVPQPALAQLPAPGRTGPCNAPASLSPKPQSPLSCMREEHWRSIRGALRAS